MDDLSPNTDDIRERNGGHGQATFDPARSFAKVEASGVDPLHALAIYDRIMETAAGRDDDADQIAQQLCVIIAEALGGLCSITLLNQHNEMMHLAGAHDVNPRAQSLLAELLEATKNLPRDMAMAAQALRSGGPVLRKSISEAELRAIVIPEFSRYIEEVGIESVMAVPLKARGSILGVLSVSRHKGRAPFDEGDLALLTGIGLRAAVLLENALLLHALRNEVVAASSTAQALDASEQRFRSIFDSTALGIEIMDPAGVILDINRAFERMTGFSQAEMLGRPYGTLQHPEDTPRFMQMLTEIKMNLQTPVSVENRIVCKDGALLWVRTHLAPVNQPDQSALRFIVALHEDISGRKRTEQYFQAVLEATPNALVMVDAEGRILLINRQMEALFGYARHEIVGQPVEMLIPEWLRGQHPLHRAGYLLDPHVRPMGAGQELFGLRKDGSEFPVEISLSPLEADGTPRSFPPSQTSPAASSAAIESGGASEPGTQVVVAAIRDISERKEREAALLHSERMLVEAQRIARLGSLDYDIANERLEASHEARRIFGFAPGEPINSDTLRAHMHPDDEQRVVDRTYAALNNHTVTEFEFRVVHPDGIVRIIHDRVQGIYADDGKPVRMIGTVQDVTEQRQAETELAELRNHLQTSVELERLRLAQELHDGPMQDLYGSSYRLDELMGGTDQTVQAALGEVNDEIQRTISELRTIAKELRPPAISNFGLEKAIRSYVEDFREKHPNIELHLSLAQDRQLLPETTRLTLFRVFQQALANVVRHSKASEVRVRFSLDAEEARLEISDNGAGFSVPSNWMGFVRHGHYGLAGAAERVHALGGILLVDSAPQRSTTVTAVIPWAPAQPSVDDRQAAGSPLAN